MLLCPFCQTPVEDRDSWHCSSCNKRPEQKDSITFLSPNTMLANYPKEVFGFLAEVENGNFWFEGRNKLLISTLRSYLPRKEQQKKYLEIGCGTGFVFRGIADAFPEMDVYGSEFYHTGLEFAAARTPRGHFFQMDAHNLPFREEFDIIGAFDVLEHIEDDMRVLSEIAKALKSRGHILITVPQHAWMWSEHDTTAGHVRRYSKKDLLEKLELTGFNIVKVTSFVSLLLPCMYIFRLISRGDSGVSARQGLINMIFSATMTLERKLIESGLSFPVGGSLLVLARKNSINIH